MTDIYEQLILEVRQNWHPDDSSGTCIDADLGLEAAKEIESLRAELEAVKQERDDWRHSHAEKQEFCLDCEKELLACQKERDELREALEVMLRKMGETK